MLLVVPMIEKIEHAFARRDVAQSIFEAAPESQISLRRKQLAAVRPLIRHKIAQHTAPSVGLRFDIEEPGIHTQPYFHMMAIALIDYLGKCLKIFYGWCAHPAIYKMPIGKISFVNSSQSTAAEYKNIGASVGASQFQARFEPNPLIEQPIPDQDLIFILDAGELVYFCRGLLTRFIDAGIECIYECGQ
jgi:hypothetical protein